VSSARNSIFCCCTFVQMKPVCAVSVESVSSHMMAPLCACAWHTCCAPRAMQQFGRGRESCNRAMVKCWLSRCGICAYRTETLSVGSLVQRVFSQPKFAGECVTCKKCPSLVWAALPTGPSAGPSSFHPRTVTTCSALRGLDSGRTRT
jgi:hypothetical protein